MNLRLEQWEIEVTLLPWAVMRTRIGNVLLVLVELLESILQVLDRDIGVAVVVAAQTSNPRIRALLSNSACNISIAAMMPG